MLGPTEFRDLVSGRRRGAGASTLRGLLRAAEVPYTAAMGWRNRRYDRGHALVHRVGVPVVSVGNLTLGGTGKTPMVKWLVQWFQARDLRIAIVSRGYGSNGDLQNDEALELRQSLGDVPHVQNPDRVVAAETAISQFGSQVVVLDDGFQHRRLARDLDIVLLDALEPFGYDHVFPRGTLREPSTGLQRAQVVCLSRSDAIPAEQRDAIRDRVRQLAPKAAWCECTHAASGLIDLAGHSRALGELAGRRVAAFCGIGNPAGFRHTLAGTGCQIAAWREFADHHAYNLVDFAEVNRLAAGCNAEFIVCTHKDLVKLAQQPMGGRPVLAVTIDMQFVCGQELLETALERVAR
jgi:tetraacyldisaccharide 4'-kinase